MWVKASAKEISNQANEPTLWTDISVYMNTFVIAIDVKDRYESK